MNLNKNNKQPSIFNNAKQRFSLRKLTIGLASVMLGLTFLGVENTVNSQTVHADEIPATTNDDDGDLEIPSEPAQPGDNKHVDVDYGASDQDQTINYKDDQGNPAKDKNGDDVPAGHVTGKTDDKGKTVPVPDGWKLKNDGDKTTDLTNPDPNTGKVPDKNVVIEHGTHTTTPGKTHTTGEQIKSTIDQPTGKDNTYTQDITTDDVNKTLHRTVTIKTPTHENETSTNDNVTDQTIAYHRSADVDTVTGKVTKYNDWTLTDPNNSSFAEITVPTVDGYTANVTKIDAQNGPTDSNGVDSYTDPKIVVTYTANSQSVNYQFVDNDDNGTNVSTQNQTGVTDQTKNFTLTIPDGYKLADGATLPTSYKFGVANPDITIHLVHDIQKDIDPNKGNKIPDGAKDPSNHDKLVTTDDAKETVTRTITINVPTHENQDSREAQDRTENVTLTRSFNFDPVTKNVTWNAWSTGNFAKVDVPVVAGYTASQTTIDADTATDGYTDPKIAITYTANEQSKTYKFVDDDANGGQVGSDIVVSGKTDETVNTGLQVPENYDLAGDLPTSVKLGATNPTVEIHLTEHHIVDATKDDLSKDPVKPTTDDHGKNVTESDFTKTITRTITFNEPTGKSSTDRNAVDGTQTITLTRTANLNKVTNTLTWNPWQPQSLTEVTVPTFDGYTMDDNSNVTDGKIAELTVNNDNAETYQDPKIVINYTAQDGHKKVTYIDENGNPAKDATDETKNVPDSEVTGKTDDMVKLPIPDGWTLVDGQTDSVKIPGKTNDQDTPITVKIKHGIVTVDNQHPVNPGDKIPGTTDKHYGTGLTENDLNAVGTRTIIFHFPASYNEPDDVKAMMDPGTNNTITQKVIFTRSAIVDTATGKVVRYTGKGKDGWDSNPDPAVYAAIKIPRISGYKAVLRGETKKVTVNGLTTPALFQLFSVSFMALPTGSTDFGASEISETPVAKPDKHDESVKPGTTTDGSKPVKTPETDPVDQKDIGNVIKDAGGDQTGQTGQTGQSGQSGQTGQSGQDQNEQKPAKPNDNKNGSSASDFNKDSEHQNSQSQTDNKSAEASGKTNTDDRNAQNEHKKANTNSSKRKHNRQEIATVTRKANRKSVSQGSMRMNQHPAGTLETPEKAKALGDTNMANDHNVKAKNAEANTLPQTGEKKSSLGLIGLAFASLAGILGFGVKKRKND